MSGGYDKPVRLPRLFQGLFIGSIVILTFYALLPEDFRFSRALIVFGAIWGFISMMGLRTILHIFKIKNFRLGINLNKRYAIVGNQDEAVRVAELLRKSDLNPGLIGLISSEEREKPTDGYIGHIDQLKEIIKIYKIDEVIFCAKDLPAHTIIDYMSGLNIAQVEYKIAPPESLSIIGSNSINTSGDTYIIELDSIAKPNNKRSKRLLDFLASIIFLISFPIIFIINKKPFGFIRNLFLVLIGHKSWVGYKVTQNIIVHKLPKIKPGVLYPTDIIKDNDVSSETIDRLNLLYARNYKILTDINIIFNGIRNLGR